MKNKLAGGVRFLYVRTYVQYMTGTYEWKICIRFCLFILAFSIPSPGLGVSKTRDLFFRGPTWMRLKNNGSFWVGQLLRASHETEEACEWRICSSLSRPFGAGPASGLFIVGCRRCPWCDTYQVPGYSNLFLDHSARFYSFLRLVLQTKYSRIVCLLLAAVFLLFCHFSRFFLRQSVCARAAWWLYYIKKAGELAT